MSRTVLPPAGPATPLARVLDRLAAVVPNGVGYYARCPVHGEGAPLHVRADGRGRVVLRCPKGCRARDITASLGFDSDDLTPDAPADDAAASAPAREDALALHGLQVLLCDSRESARAVSQLGYLALWMDLPDGLWRDDFAGRVVSLAEDRGADGVVVVADGGARSRVLCERAAATLHRLGVAVRLLALPGLASNDTVWDWLDTHEAPGAREDDPHPAFEAALAGASAWTTEAPTPAPSRFQVLSAKALLELPPPTWLWDGLLPDGALAALVGEPGAGKSFVALDLAARIAAGGGTVLGRRVPAGAVLYVAAEGRAGLSQRLAAWCHAHGVDADTLPLHFVAEGVNLFTPGDEAELIAACRQVATPDRPVRLVVIDTLARVMAGGEENSAKDVGLVIARAEQIQRATGAAVLFNHHTAKNSDSERGSTALRGAVDALLLIKADDPEAPAGLKLLVTAKQKDAPPTEPICFVLDPVAADTAHGRVQSCRVALSAVRWTDEPDADAPLTPTQIEALRVLRGFGTNGATATEWCDASGLAKKTFYRARGILDRGGYVLPGASRGQRYQVTALGLRALSAPKDSVIGVNAGVTRGVTPGVAGGGGVTPPRGSDHHPPSQRGDAGRPATPTATPNRDTAPPDWRLFDREFSDDEAPT
jgi:predicted kinase